MKIPGDIAKNLIGEYNSFDNTINYGDIIDHQAILKEAARIDKEYLEKEGIATYNIYWSDGLPILLLKDESKIGVYNVESVSVEALTEYLKTAKLFYSKNIGKTNKSLIILSACKFEIKNEKLGIVYETESIETAVTLYNNINDNKEI